MKKQILNVGKTLSRAEQKSVNGGGACYPSTYADCQYPGAVWNQYEGGGDWGDCCNFLI